MSEYLPEPKFSGGGVNVESDWSNYATKEDLKNATGVDTSDFAKKTDLDNLNTDVDKLDIINLKMYQVIWSIWKWNTYYYWHSYQSFS